ncbi:Malignant T-cell-amplified sequence 1 [Smittium culicis]|uniref:Malignant T-cell-amplified sequence 1 n=1 Tax=Smittium culicis TaxID=133412 RepID=A0A1R1YDH5_9FUNG|nr:Malignant T-cell-amplified sequence 1 [Smittium culicis]
MCPGLTSPGAWLPEENIPVGKIVAVMAEGKEHSLAIGVTKMSTDDMKSLNKGIGVDLVIYLGDPLWRSSID